MNPAIGEGGLPLINDTGLPAICTNEGCCGPKVITDCETDGPTADFRAPLWNDVPCLVTFSDESIPGTTDITDWLWAFGDGETSTEQNPSHEYPERGTIYPAFLQVTDANDCIDDITRSVGCKRSCCKQCGAEKVSDVGYTIPPGVGDCSGGFEGVTDSGDLYYCEWRHQPPEGIFRLLLLFGQTSDLCVLEFQVLRNGLYNHWRKTLGSEESCFGHHVLTKHAGNGPCTSSTMTVDVF